MERLIFPLTLTGVPVLALAGLGCLTYCKGERHHRHLVWTAAVFLGALALFFGGNIILGSFGLTWRNLPSAILCITLLISGWVGIVLTLACLLPMEWPDAAPVLRRAVKGAVLFFAAVVLFVTLWLGPLLLAFAFGDSEQVVEYNGRTLVERMEGFLSPDYGYYEYHGLLFRGTERIWSGPTHIWGDFDGKEG